MAGPRGGVVGGGRGGALENSISIQMHAVTNVHVRWRSFCLSRYGVGFKVHTWMFRVPIVPHVGDRCIDTIAVYLPKRRMYVDPVRAGFGY